jgi:hypothetical protein
MDALDLLQWPAMAVTVTSTWLVASSQASRRQAGFWLFLFSNVLWVIWGWSSDAPALVVLQVLLAVMNIRGAMKAEKAEKAS